MKKFSLCTHVLILSFFVSCTTDDSSTVKTTVQSKKIQEKNSSVFLKNLSSYDTLGSFQNQVMEMYESQNNTFTSLEDIFAQVKLITEDLGNTQYASGSEPLEDLAYIVDNPESCLDTFIENSILTDPAKASFSDFAASLLAVESLDYDTIYTTIAAYEQAVRDDANLTSEDKHIILTVTALIEYSYIYCEDKRKDKDWETSVGNRNISAKLQGAFYGDTTAVIMSVTMELYLDINQ